MSLILIVEDDPMNLRLASVILQAAGYETRGAADAWEAEAAIEERVPDLVLLDLGLPGVDGYALTRELKSRAATRHVPILVVTSYALKGDEMKAMDAGCTGYLRKPIDRPVLLQHVQSLLAPSGVPA
jgi:CheY-like chemotaxis protein